MNPTQSYEQSLTSQNTRNNQINCNKNMNSNKKVIRLTESKLKEMIAEAVQETLCETGLDPRTLASAARKAMDRASANPLDMKNVRRMDKFTNAARDAWNERYGFTRDPNITDEYEYTYDENGYCVDKRRVDDEDVVLSNYLSPEYGDCGTRYPSYLPTSNIEPADGDKFSHVYNPRRKKPYGFELFGDELRTYDDIADKYQASEDDRDKRFGKGMKVAKQMANGTGKYNREKGRWED